MLNNMSLVYVIFYTFLNTLLQQSELLNLKTERFIQHNGCV